MRGGIAAHRLAPARVSQIARKKCLYAARHKALTKKTRPILALLAQMAAVAEQAFAPFVEAPRNIFAVQGDGESASGGFFVIHAHVFTDFFNGEHDLIGWNL